MVGAKMVIRLLKRVFLAGVFMGLFSVAAKAACTSPAAEAGTIQWITADSKVKYCNGTSWQLTADTVTGTACTAAGEMRFFSSELHYCNGSFYVKTAPATNHDACAALSAGYFYYATGGPYYWYCSGSFWKRMAP